MIGEEYIRYTQNKLNAPRRGYNMKKKLYVCFNHTLSEEQINALALIWRCDIEVVYAAEHIKKTFGNIPNDWAAHNFREFARDIRKDIQDKNPDFVFITGHAWVVAFVYEQVTYRYELPYKPFFIDTKSERISIDKVQPDGSVIKQNTFQFAGWRIMT